MNIIARLSIFTCVILSFVYPFECKAGDKVTEANYREYFKNLSFPDQKTVMNDVVTEMRTQIPMVIDDYRQWTGIIYMSEINTILKIFTFTLESESIDWAAIQEYSALNRIQSTNSICTASLYKTWMFEAGLTIRNNFILASGQNLFNYSIDKNDCIEAGYQY